MGTISHLLNMGKFEEDDMSPGSYTYQSPLEDVVGLLIDHLPDLEAHAAPALAEEIATGCLMFACTWLNTGGAGMWKLNNPDMCRHHIQVCLRELSGHKDLTDFGKQGWEDNVYRIGVMNRWHISMDLWIRACAVFTYWIADTTLRYNKVLFNDLTNSRPEDMVYTPTKIDTVATRAGHYRFSLRITARKFLS